MKKLNAYTIYMTLVAISALCFSIAFTTSAIYRFEMAQLNPLQLVLVGTVLEASVFLFEIPTGIVADIYSRRLSVIIGYALIGVGLMVEGMWPLFSTILLAQAIWGIGYTFTSGALDAWLADELGEERLPQIYLRGSQFRQVASFIGIFIGVGIATFRLNIPMLVGGSGLLGLAIFLWFLMPESGFSPAPEDERETWQTMKKTFTASLHSIRARPLLITILGITLIYGLYSEAADRLWEAHFLENFNLPPLGTWDTLYWFAIINGAVMLISLGVVEWVKRRNDQMGHQQTTIPMLIVLSAGLSLGLIFFGLATNFAIALAAYGAFAVMRSTLHPIYSAWINRGIDSKVRATVLSTIGQMDAIGQTVGGPILGATATQFGLRVANVVAGLVITPVVALYLRAARQEEKG